MTRPIDDAVWSILEQTAPIELRSVPTESVQAIIADIQQGRDPEVEAANGGFGFGAEALVEHIVLGVHVALAVVHSAMLLKHRHSEREMLDRLRQIAEALDEKIELTDAIITKLNAIHPS